MVRVYAQVMVLTLGLLVLPAAGGLVEVQALPATVTDEVSVPLPASGEVGAQDAADVVTTEPIAAPMAFSMIGFELPDGIEELRVRTSVDGEQWTDWTATERFDAEDGPDVDSEEAATDRSGGFAEPVWVEEATHFQIEVPAGEAEMADEVRASVIDSAGLSGGPTERNVVSEPASSADASDRPDVVTREQWGANESLSRSTRAADEVHMGVVHHTATSNNYSDPHAVMRAMYEYHTVELGWADLGYNIVVDQQGTVYEGRAGGLETGIVGAHARGYNTGSFGVSVIGNFDLIRPPQAALDAVAEVIAWQSDVHDIDPQGWTDGMNGSWHRTLLGHRDVGSTSCPGTHFHPLLDDVREDAAERMSAEPGDPTGSQPDPTQPIDEPETTITSGPDELVAEDEATLDFSATGDVSYYQCRWGDDPWYDCASPRTFTNIEDGEHTFSARAVAPNGEVESDPATWTWTVDRSLAAAFSDLDRSIHVDAIEAVAEAEITQGYDDGTFRPRLEVSREHMASFLARALDLELDLTADDTPEFSDLDRSIHAEAITKVASAEITEGYEDGTFRPDELVTREQMASFLARALDLDVEAGEHEFSDLDRSVHEDAVAAVAAEGITEGYEDGTFRPRESVTREQMAAFLARALEL